MKINEIIQEGILDTLKQSAGTAAKSGVAGIKNVAGKVSQGYQNIQATRQANQAIKSQQMINKSVINSIQQKYNEFSAQLGGQVTVQQALTWFENIAGVKATSLPTDTSPGAIQRWLTIEIPAYISAKAQKEIPVPKTPKPKVPYSAIQQQAPVTGQTTATNISPPNPGAPTPQEYDKFQQKLQAAMQKQA